MSVPPESGGTPAQCACTNISLMQLFHELKQKFPAVPDHVVSSTIDTYCHDKQACETHLHSEAKASLTHAYHASSSAAAKQLNENRVTTQHKCPNQLIIRHDLQNLSAIQSVTCQSPQTATLSNTNEDDKLPNTDANQNVVEAKNFVKINLNNNHVSSPVINIDYCEAKYSNESTSDLELTNEEATDDRVTTQNSKEIEEREPESINYRILKSNKVKCNLHEKLEKGKEKKTIKKEEPLHKEQIHKEETLLNEEPPTEKVSKEAASKESLEPTDKPKRPNTLEFLKPNPDIAFKETLQEPKGEPSKSVSPITSTNKQEVKDTTPGGTYWPGGYPVNLSVNVNCHMDYSRGYDPWLEDYDNPRAITSVNLTVCTPTSNMASPVRERDDDGGFEGHVTVTVSPSTARPPPRRRAPPPPPQPVTQPVEPQRSARPTVDNSHERTLIERQKERLGRLAAALAQDKHRIQQLSRETQILSAPPPSAAAARKLREYVQKLRHQCDTLAKRAEMGGGTEPDASDFYSNIYTGQHLHPSPQPHRPAPPPPPSPREEPWTCHVCTFRNHAALPKCEQCEMPRIYVGTFDRTLDSGFGSFRERDRTASGPESGTYSADGTCVDVV